MNVIKHLVFTEHLRGFSRDYDVKEAGIDGPLYEAIPVGLWQNSLDIFQAEASRGQRAFTIKSRNFFSLTYEVIASENKFLGTVTRECVLGHEWVIMDASTGLFGNIYRSFTSAERFLGGEYHIKIDEHIICTLDLRQNLWDSCKIDLHYCPAVAASINEVLLVSATLLILSMRGESGGG